MPRPSADNPTMPTDWHRPIPRAPRAPAPPDPRRGPVRAGSPEDVCYGIPVDTLTQITGCDPSTARRWKRGYPVPEPARRLIALSTTRDLGLLCAPWRGWILSHEGLLVSPEAWCFTPGHVRATLLSRE